MTKPTPGMRQAMFEAEVGDDVYGEDPTVQGLQERVAEILGKEAALFVPSGVMGNQLALKVHTQPGDEVILERDCHIFNYESGAAGLISSVQLNVLDGRRGLLEPDQVEQAVRPPAYWNPRSRLVCLENTVNKSGGVVYPMEAVHGIAEVVRRHGLRFHLDGARLWNASAATGIPEREYAAPFDTVCVCLSKGLGAPVGSVLAGTAELIREAHRYRKLFGGGMRQVGILAAAGLYALEHHRPRLADDHRKAKRLADGLAEFPTFRIDSASVETNIVMFDVVCGRTEAVVGQLQERGVLVSQFGPTTIRATTHLDISEEGIEYAVDVLRELYGEAVTA